MDEAVLKRTMPHSLDAEKSVIGSMLTDKDAIVIAAGILLPEDFYAKQYGLLFKAIVELDNEGKNVDLITLKERLLQMDVPQEVSEMEFVKEILAVTYTAANVKQYCDFVKGKALLRKLINLTDSISNTCYEGKEEVDAVLEG